MGSLLFPPVQGTMAQGSTSEDLGAPPSCRPGLGLRPALILSGSIYRHTEGRLLWRRDGVTLGCLG